MRVFQNSGVYPAYLRRLDRLASRATDFSSRLAIFHNDRFGATHFLQPVLEHSPTAFFTNNDDVRLQELWAREHGLPQSTTPSDILLAQIEQHRTEVLYDIDPTRHPPGFLKRLPGCVRVKLAWRAAPLGGASLAGYDLLLCNFPGILSSYRKMGWRSEYFWPAHDPVMDEYAANAERPTDLLFVGTYSRHHRRRAELLEQVAPMAGAHQIALHLECSRLTRFAESPLGRLLPMASHRRPSSIRSVARPALFGRDLYEALSRAKVVLNGAIDMAGNDRGNMRCFEAMGLGCLLLSDSGTYPEGMIDGRTLLTYASTSDALEKIRDLLSDQPTVARIAQAGLEMLRTNYSKARQWSLFQQLVSTC